MNKKHALHSTVKFTNMRELAEWRAKETPDGYAFSYRNDPREKEPTKVTYKQFADDVRALASELLSMGCEGKHISVIGKSSYEFVVTYYATFAINGVLIPLDVEWHETDLADTVANANADYLFGDEDAKDKLTYIAEHVELKEAPYYMNAKNESRSIKSLIEAGREKYAADPEPYHSTCINPLKLSLLVFTSGTTGKGKGVMLNQRAILSDMYNVQHYIDFGKRSVSVLPPQHSYGSTIMFCGHVMIGAEVYISSGIRYVTKELAEVKPQHLCLVPLYLETFYRKIIASLKDKGKYDTVFKMLKIFNVLHVGVKLRRKVFSEILAAFGGEVKMVISGGAPISREIMDFFQGIGIQVLNGYGITECAPLISVNRSKHNVVGSVGLPIDGTEVYIDEPNEDGEGEILFRGDNMMLGYYNNEEATADAIKNGYFRTGDYGKLGKDGSIFITGRKKNLIILSNGKNVYPEEIESEFIAVPGVLDIIVYEGQSKRGLAHNAIVAEIYPEEDYFKKQGITDIHAYLKPFVDDYNKTAVPYKKIAILKVRTEPFPKNTLRKIMRFKLDMTID